VKDIIDSSMFFFKNGILFSIFHLRHLLALKKEKLKKEFHFQILYHL